MCSATLFMFLAMNHVGDMRLYMIGCIIHTVVTNIKYLSVSVEMVYVVHTICVILAEVCLKLLLGTLVWLLVQTTVVPTTCVSEYFNSALASKVSFK